MRKRHKATAPLFDDNDVFDSLFGVHTACFSLFLLLAPNYGFGSSGACHGVLLGLAPYSKANQLILSIPTPDCSVP
jgi:hypothetical protein